MLKPESIYNISHRSKSKWFRVRNTNTLSDYLVLGFEDFLQIPKFATVFCCATSAYTSIDCYKAEYALLSLSDGEVQYFRSNKKQDVIELVKFFYKAYKSEESKEKKSQKFRDYDAEALRSMYDDSTDWS